MAKTLHSVVENRELRRNYLFENAEKPKDRRLPSVTIGKSREEIYAFLTDVTNFRLFMRDIQSVHPLSERSWHWISVTESGKKTEWDTEIVINKPGEVLAWKNLADSDDEMGAVTLEPAPGGRGTVVSLKHAHENALDRLKGFAAELVGKNPRIRAAVDLGRLKAYLETGEVPTIHGQPSGRESQSTNH